ncbi:LysE family translocator [Endozoicomonas elysicola]|uniref:Amino acid transporter n=1 Tax=Endozoicomonas elysicola TaxID=305900 RepID=A0A081K5T6_9GAMM|nr:LysE family transporter [Endozoicomonas elysicola]KEI69512.1 amino acid transporter [Endozoicomonas elysicola]
METINVSEYMAQLISMVMIAGFMAISPGADFVMVTRNSLFYGRKAGLYSSLGICAAIWLHVAYSIAGLAVIISKSILLFSIVKYLGAAYLIYIGWKTFQNRSDIDIAPVSGSLSALSALKEGFITNALNPKTTLFFLSIFTQVVSPQTPLVVQMLYGAIISMAHLIWFSCVSVFLTQPRLLALFMKSKSTIEKLVGGVLIAFGIKVAAS